MKNPDLFASILLSFSTFFFISILIKKKLKQNKENHIFKRLFKKYPAKLQIFSFLGFITVIFNRLSLPYFESWIIPIIFVIVLGSIVIKYRILLDKNLPTELEKQKKHETIEKYLPKKKRK